MNQVDIFEETPDGAYPQHLRKSDRMLVLRSTSSSLTLVARKIYNAMLYVAQRQGIERQTYSAPLRRLAKLIDYGSNDNQALKEVIREMQTCLIQWESPVGRDDAYWSSAQLIGGVDLRMVGGQNVITWEYSSNFKRDVLEPMPYATLSLVTNARLRSIAALALYEICARYKNSRRTTRHHWRWWRDALSTQPGRMNTGGEYKIFHRDVLRRAVSELNSQSEIEVRLVTYREGRAIGDIQFEVQPNPLAAGRAEEGADADPVNMVLHDRARSVGLTVKWTDRFIQLHGETAFTAGLDALEVRIQNRRLEPLASPARWLEEVLSRGGMSATPPPRPIAVAGDSSSRRHTFAEQEFREQRVAEALRVFATCDDESKLMHRHSFEAQVLFEAHIKYQEDWRKNGAAGRLVGPLFRTYLCESLFGAQWDSPILELPQPNGVS